MIKIEFWSGDTAREIRGDHAMQAMVFYVMTCRDSRMTGLYFLGMSTICRELGMDPGLAKDVLARLELHGFLKYDPQEEVIWVPNLGRHQVGEKMAPNDTRRGMILKQLEDFKRHPYLRDFFDKYSGPWGILCPIGSGPNGDLFPDPCSLISDQKRETKTRAKSKQVPIPDDWTVSERLIAWGLGKRFSEQDLRDQAEKFFDHAKKKGVEHVDWDAAFRTWMRNSPQFGGVKLMPLPVPPKPQKNPVTSESSHRIDNTVVGAIISGEFFEKR